MIFEGNMARKRSFGNENRYGVSCKHPRPAEHGGNKFPCSDASQNCQYLDGEHEDNCSRCHNERSFASESITEVRNVDEKGHETSIVLSTPFWTGGSVIQENVKTEPAFHISLFPEIFEFEYRVRALVQSEEIYSTLMNYPPQKPVPIGLDHQANIPEWSGRSNNRLDSLDKSNLLDGSSSSSVPSDDVESEKTLVGTCIIPMPDLEAPKNSYCNGSVKNNCGCLDRGSILCTRQHVAEAREILRQSVGSKTFEELGFYDMGEEVADKWTEEEQQAFDDAVLSNPASLGMNFWNHLSTIFPSRTKMEFVSYYFNVFILRKRAEQNRFDPINIDSDNDQWQSGECGVTEEEENDSGIESPIDAETPDHDQVGREQDLLEEIDEENEVNNCSKNIETKSPRHVTTTIEDKGNTDVQLQDDSCTSYESLTDMVGNPVIDHFRPKTE